MRDIDSTKTDSAQIKNSRMFISPERKDTRTSWPDSISSQAMCARCAINRFLGDKDMLHGRIITRATGDKLKIGTTGDELARGLLYCGRVSLKLDLHGLLLSKPSAPLRSQENSYLVNNCPQCKYLICMVEKAVCCRLFVNFTKIYRQISRDPRVTFGWTA